MIYKHCLLHGCDEADEKGAACKGCGWHIAEHQRRLWLIRHGGVKPSRDGLRRLVLRHAEERSS